MTLARAAILLLLLLPAACSDGSGASLSAGVGGTIRTEYGRVIR